MPEENMNIENHSGDRKYFTLIPNMVAYAPNSDIQALYFQMKRACGEKGHCSVGRKAMMKRLGIGKEALKASYDYLIENKLVRFDGVKKIMTNGGLQEIPMYSIVDVWDKNIEFFGMITQLKGGSETDTLTKVLKGGSETAQRGGYNRLRGGAGADIKKNYKKNIKKRGIVGSEKFIKPTLGQVQEYCKERVNTVDPEQFCDFYESKGWMVGKNKMKDWRAAVRNWERDRSGIVQNINTGETIKV